MTLSDITADSMSSRRLFHGARSSFPILGMASTVSSLVRELSTRSVCPMGFSSSSSPVLKGIVAFHCFWVKRYLQNFQPHLTSTKTHLIPLRRQSCCIFPKTQVQMIVVEIDEMIAENRLCEFARRKMLLFINNTEAQFARKSQEKDSLNDASLKQYNLAFVC